MSLSLKATLEAPTPASNEYYGGAVTLSGDGTRMAVGAPGEGDGRVYIYLYSGGSWSLEETLSESTSGMPATSDFGFSVSFNDDASRLAVGDPGGNGAAYMFKRSGTTWSYSRTISAPRSGKDFGYSIGLSGNSGILLVGAPGEDIVYANGGAIQSYRRVGTGDNYTPLTTSGGRLVAGSGNNQYVGYSISISYNGEWAAFGLPEIGRTYFAKINTSTAGGLGIQTIYVGGTTVAISKDGDWALIGNQTYSGDETNQGYVLVYERTSTTYNSWTLRDTITQPTPTQNAYFSLVGISGDASKVCVANKLGEFFSYDLAGDGTASYASTESYSPSSLGTAETNVVHIALNETGSVIALGSDTVSTNQGRTYVYGLVTNTVSHVAALPDGQSIVNPAAYWFCGAAGSGSPHSSGISLSLSGGSDADEETLCSWALNAAGRCGGYLLGEDTEITLTSPIENIGSIAFYFGVNTASYSSGSVTIDLSNNDLTIQSGTVAGGPYGITVGETSLTVTYPVSAPSQIIYVGLTFASDSTTLSGSIPISFR